MLWDHRRICGPSLTETSLCGARLYFSGAYLSNVFFPLSSSSTLRSDTTNRVQTVCSYAPFINKKRFIAQKIQRLTQGYKIVPLTNLPQLSFAEAYDRVSTVLGMYKCSSEKQVQREKHCISWVNGYRRRCLGRLCVYFLYWRWRSAKV